MKKIFYFFATGALFLSTMNCANAQNTTSDREIMQVLKNYYKTFNATCATVKGGELHRKLDSLQQKYCSNSLLNKMKALGPDFDLLGYNPYTDMKHLNTLTVTKDPTEEYAYVVSYVQSTANDSKVVIHVNVADNPEGLKITSIK